MTPTTDVLTRSRAIIDRVAEQESLIHQAADLFTATILAGRMVHVFGSGHSRMMVEEMWPRYGSFPGWNPIVELSLSFHNLVVGANGQRQAMFLENVSGLAARILRNYELSAQDTALIISSSGCNVVPIEMAEELQKRGIKVVAIVTQKHLDASTTRDARGKKNSATSPTSSSTPEHPSATPWSPSPASTPQSPQARPSAAAFSSTPSKPKPPPASPPPATRPKSSPARSSAARNAPPPSSNPPTTNTPTASPNSTPTLVTEIVFLEPQITWIGFAACGSIQK